MSHRTETPVEIFATGFHHGRQWTCADLQQIYGNYLALSVAKNGEQPYLRCPVVIGHEEDQQVLKRSDLPAAGWLEPNLQYVSTGPNSAKLTVPFGEIPDDVAGWVNDKQYRHVSSEVYDDFVDHAGVHHGLTLRRVALLGAEPPAQKQLAELPPVVRMADGQKTTVVRFSDQGSGGMNRDQMLQLVKASGAPLTPKFLDSLSDEQLAELITSLNSGGQPAPDAANPGTPPAPDAGQMSDGGTPAPAPAPAPSPAPANPVPAGSPSQVILKYADAQARRVLNMTQAAENLAQKRLADEKSRTVHAFCERWVKEGKLTPAEIDRSVDPKTKLPKNPANVHDRLMRADNLNKVHRFGDRAELMSEFDLQVAEIEARQPVHRFSEQVADHVPGQPGRRHLTPERRAELLGSSVLGRSIIAKEKTAAAK